MLVETVLGNMNEPDWTLRLKEARIDDLVLDQWDAQKSRIRKMTSYRGGAVGRARAWRPAARR